MRVGSYQCRCHPGCFEENLATVTKGLEVAEERGIEIMAFPESLLTGYYCDADKARKNSFAIDSPEVKKLLSETAKFGSTFMVGFNEQRGEALYNTVLVAEGGRLLGTYSKAFPCFDYFTPGREFPVFERNGVKFGVIICADGAFIEPSRILALKGARIIFAPHYNFLHKEWVVVHFYMVRHDHSARAIENGVYFLRANNVSDSVDSSLPCEGVGYGDSYLLDPLGQIVSHAGLHTEGFVVGDLDLTRQFYVAPAANSRQSWAALGQLVEDAFQEGQSTPNK